MRPAVRGAVNLMIIKARIEHFYKQCAHLDADLAEYKRAHGYCGGRPFCMEALNPMQSFKTCRECREAERSHTGTRRQSKYGAMRQRERAKNTRRKAA